MTLFGWALETYWKGFLSSGTAKNEMTGAAKDADTEDAGDEAEPDDSDDNMAAEEDDGRDDSVKNFFGGLTENTDAVLLTGPAASVFRPCRIKPRNAFSIEAGDSPVKKTMGELVTYFELPV